MKLTTLSISIFIMTFIVSCSQERKILPEEISSANLTYRSRTISKLSQLTPDDDGNLVIPSSLIIEIDTNIDVKRLLVEGSLHCPRSRKKFIIKAENIHISGKLSCGADQSSRFVGSLVISLKKSNLQGMIRRGITVVNGGVLELHGLQKSHTWQKLAADLLPNSKQVTLSKDSNWKVGDKIVVSSSSFNMNETEAFSIIEANGRTLTLDKSADYFHKGIVMNLSGHSIDQRSTITNLSRNIVITSDGSDHFNSQLGGHVMIMMGGVAKIDSVQFDNLGRMGELGRYPFHWHMVREARGQYIKNSVISNSYQRCVVVHKTNEALVENNVCYNHFGHGFFLEHGSERKNILTNNLALVGKKPPFGRHLLESDLNGVRSRYQGPASYWISNPDNTITDNIAAGSEGTGFWMSFVSFDVCDLNDPCKKPVLEDTLAFDRNVAHSSRIGMTWDGAPPSPLITEADRHARLVNSHYKPSEKAHFNDLVAYKNLESGIYFRGDASTFENTILADNFWSAFFAYSQHLKNSVIVGHSSNMSSNDKELLAFTNPSLEKAGVIIYDGPFEMENVDFLEFPSTNIYYQHPDFSHLQYDITPIPFVSVGGANRFENKVMGLNFIPEPMNRVLMGSSSSMRWKDSIYSQSIRDLDGSLTGRVNSLVVPDHEFNYKKGCSKVSDWNAYICEDYNTGMYKFSQSIQFDHTVNFLIQRESLDSPVYNSFDILLDQFHNKFNTIIGINEIYILKPDLENKTFYNDLNQVFVTFQSEDVLDVGEIVYIEGAQRCRISTIDGVSIRSFSRLDHLQSHDNAGYVNTLRGLYFKLSANTLTRKHRNSELSNSYTSKYVISCTVIK